MSIADGTTANGTAVDGIAVDGIAVDGIVLASPDPARLRAWYDEVLGPTASGIDIEPGRIYSTRAREPMRLVPTFAVADADAVERRLIAAGATWVRELAPTPWGRIGTVLDPDGNCVQVLETRSDP